MSSGELDPRTTASGSYHKMQNNTNGSPIQLLVNVAIEWEPLGPTRHKNWTLPFDDKSSLSKNYWSIFPRQVSEANEDVKVEAKICAPKYPMECSSLKLRDDGLTGKEHGQDLFF